MRRLVLVVVAGVSMLALITVAVFTGKRGGHSAEPELQVSTLWKAFEVTEEDEVACIIPTKGGKYLAAGNTYVEDKGHAYWVGELGTDGRKKWERSYAAKYGEKVSSLVPARGGRFWGVGGSHSPFVWMFDQNGELLFMNVIRNDLFTQAFAAMEAGDGAVLLAGKQGSDGWLARVAESGDVLWTQTFDRGKDECIMSATSSGQGHFVLVAVSGTYDKFGSGYTDLWILECDESGKLVRECTMPGRVAPAREPRVAAAAGRIVVGYIQSGFPEATPWLTCLDTELKKVWDKQVGQADLTFWGPSVVANPNGGFLVGWNRSGSYEVMQVDAGGHVLWRKSFPGAQGQLVPGGRGLGRVFLRQMR